MQNDIAINNQLKRFTPNPVLVIIEAEPKEIGLPTEAYVEVQEVHDVSYIFFVGVLDDYVQTLIF